MREMIVTIITLLHKYNRFWIVNLVLVASLGLAFASYLPDCFELIYSSIFLLVMAAWEISDVFLFERKAIVENELADTKDKLCLSEHKVERLTSELETTQAALLKVKKQMNTTRQKEVDIAEEVSAEESSDKEVAPKPKRKPAPRGTRKPKTKNENKD
ncbi:MAG: hypothetical protein J6B82_05815 [Bacteroidaceae bacterium]|nr:hypothetical protein [Bacteroidaceae bacterium]